MTEKYSVGEVARLLDITPSALRFFESEKIINTQKFENGRRYYSLEDLVRLISSKKYRSMGISLKTIAGQFEENGDSRLIIASRMQKKAEEAMEKSLYYKCLSEIIADQVNTLNKIDENLGEFSVSARQEYYLLTDPRHQLISEEKNIQKTIQKWIKGIPATKVAIVLPDESMGVPQQVVFGYVISAQHAKALHIPISDPCVKRLPQSVCISTGALIENAFTYPETVFQDMLQYMEEKSVKQDGIALAILSVVESIDPDHYHAFFDITAPFQL